MGRSDPAPKKYKESNGDDKIKDKYKTELIIRPKGKEITKQAYNTTPADKFSFRNVDDHLDYVNRRCCCSQFDYLRNNLGIKSGIEKNHELFRFQMKKVSIRNYTPKILRQEVNMGMWV